MDVAEHRQPGPEGTPVTGAVRSVEAFLAGLQAGMLGTFWMLAWMGFGAAWQRRSFWTAENLMAAVFHPNGAIRGDFGSSTWSGLALYMLVYSLLGGLFAMAVSRRTQQPTRVVLLAVAFALVWYYFSFHLLWKSLAPVLALLDPERSSIIGHLAYGLVLGRFYSHLPPAEKLVPAMAAVEQAHSDPVAPEG